LRRRPTPSNCLIAAAAPEKISHIPEEPTSAVKPEVIERNIEGIRLKKTNKHISISSVDVITRGVII